MNNCHAPKTTHGVHTLTTRGHSAIESQIEAGPTLPCTNSAAGQRNARGQEVLGYYARTPTTSVKGHGVGSRITPKRLPILGYKRDVSAG